MNKVILTVVAAFLALNMHAQSNGNNGNNGNNDPCRTIISSYNTAVTNATQIDPVFAICHNSVSSLEVNPHSNGQGNGNNPWQSQGFQASGGHGAQVGISVMMPGNKGFINLYFNRVNNSWVFQHVQGTFPNYCSKVVSANCSGASLVSNTCP